jgi:peptidoglycan/LPS O-acetylase OafA/YrhL
MGGAGALFVRSTGKASQTIVRLTNAPATGMFALAILVTAAFRWIPLITVTIFNVAALLLILHADRGDDSAVNRLLRFRLLCWLGLVSYSLYLWHQPILQATQGLLGTGVWVKTGSLTAAVGAAWLTWSLVERPSLRAKARWTDNYRSRRTIRATGSSESSMGGASSVGAGEAASKIRSQ